jgi:hypothetical protein
MLLVGREQWRHTNTKYSDSSLVRFPAKNFAATDIASMTFDTSSYSSELGTDGTDALVTGAPSSRKDPIFIVGCHRSGTSLFRMLIDSHPNISSGPEEQSIFYLSHLRNEGWKKTLDQYGMSQEEWLNMVRSIVEELQGRYAASQGKTRWAEKCPENSLIVDYLDELYPTCQVIHIVRHPKDVIASNRVKYGPKPGAYYGKRWINHVGRAETLGARLGPERFTTIKYEDLVSDPEAVLKRIFEWLGEPWSDQVLRFGERTHYYPVRMKVDGEKKFKLHTDSLGHGKSRGTFLPLLFIRLRANDLAKRFGYHLSFKRS